MTDSIQNDVSLAYLSAELASLRRRPPTSIDLHRAFDVANSSLASLEHALDEPISQLESHARRGYLAAIVLLKMIESLPEMDYIKRLQFRRTAMNMLVLLERMVSPADRALRERILGDVASARLAA